MLPVRVTIDPFDALAHLDPLLDVAQAVANAGVVMAKIASDLRLLSSGPSAGINEISLPLVQAGSSIMPGKTNPGVPEYVMQVAMQIRGVAHIVESAVAAGELELNIMEPVVLSNLQPAIQLLGRTATVFRERCVQDLVWNRVVVHKNLEAGSLLRKVEDSIREGYSSVAY